MPRWAQGYGDLKNRTILRVHQRHFVFFSFTPLMLTALIEFQCIELDQSIMLFRLEKLPPLNDINVNLVTVKIDQCSALFDNS